MNIKEAEAALGGKYKVTRETVASILGNKRTFVATRISGYYMKNPKLDELVALLQGKGHTPECNAHTEKILEAQDEWTRKWPNHCTTCRGVGGFYSSFDPSPAGVSLSPGSMMDFDPCSDCVDEGICPRCGNKVWNPDEDEIDNCPVCGWGSSDSEAMPGGADDMCPCQEAEMDRYYKEAEEFMAHGGF